METINQTQVINQIKAYVTTLQQKQATSNIDKQALEMHDLYADVMENFNHDQIDAAFNRIDEDHMLILDVNHNIVLNMSPWYHPEDHPAIEDLKQAYIDTITFCDDLIAQLTA